jgi:hypothetical protein
MSVDNYVKKTEIMEKDKAVDYVKSLDDNTNPEAILYHIGGNEMKNNAPTECVNKMSKLY